VGSEKINDENWINYSIAAGASFAYFLALPSFSHVDKGLMGISIYLFGLSLIWNTLLTVGLKNDKKLNAFIFKGLGETGHYVFFLIPLLTFGMAMLCYIWSISGSIVLFILGGLFAFGGILKLSAVKGENNMMEGFYFSKKSSMFSCVVLFSIALLLSILALVNI
tara:strand:- start:52 stop:546 length:495 start_codon:yes stop_codon:yes gene_type:complete